MNIENVKTISAFKEVEEQYHSFAIIKHSLTCPISATANKAYEKYSEGASVPLFRLHVQEARELSNYIEQKYKIKHESPQLLKIEKGGVVWDASHGNITANELEKKI